MTNSSLFRCFEEKFSKNGVKLFEHIFPSVRRISTADKMWDADRMWDTFPFPHNICKISLVYIPPFSKNGIFVVNSDVLHNGPIVHNLALKTLATQSTFVSEKYGDLQCEK